VSLDLFRASLGSEVAAFQATLLVWVAVQAAALALLLAWRVPPPAPLPAQAAPPAAG
jgi:hypothetical protein